MSYWNCVYFLMVTMSTVGRTLSPRRFVNLSPFRPLQPCLSVCAGYGDIYCNTILGKFFCLLIIIGGLVSETASAWRPLEGQLHLGVVACMKYYYVQAFKCIYMHLLIWFILQLENTGNLPHFSSPVPMTYWTCVYFLMVTMSTGGCNRRGS